VLEGVFAPFDHFRGQLMASSIIEGTMLGVGWQRTIIVGCNGSKTAAGWRERDVEIGWLPPVNSWHPKGTLKAFIITSQEVRIFIRVK
jgi:hypothetical protein